MAEETLAQKNALQLIQDRFAGYGIQGLADALRKLIADNTDAEGNISESLVVAGLRATPEYQKRFAGNIERKKLIEQDIANNKQPRFGLLSEAEYVQAEEGYRQVLKDYTLPGFYDGPESYVNLIANDISVKELGARAQAAQQAASAANPEIKQQLKSLYGIEENQLTAYFLDPAKATAALTPVATANAAALAAAAQRGGMSLTKQEAEQIAQRVAPGPTDVISSDKLFQETANIVGLTEESVSGEKSTVGAAQIVGAAAGQVEDQKAVEKERQRRLASTQAASGMATTEKGVVGLQRANRQSNNRSTSPGGGTASRQRTSPNLFMLGFL